MSSDSFIERESKVISEGVSSGLQAFCDTTLTDGKKAAESLCQKKGESTPDWILREGGYAGKWACDHAKDLYFGVAMGYLDPSQKFGTVLTTALLSWSALNTVGAAGWRATCIAWDGKSNLDSSKKDLSESVSHEVRDLAGCLSMAVIGGMGGRAAGELCGPFRRYESLTNSESSYMGGGMDGLKRINLFRDRENNFFAEERNVLFGKPNRLKAWSWREEDFVVHDDKLPTAAMLSRMRVLPADVFPVVDRPGALEKIMHDKALYKKILNDLPAQLRFAGCGIDRICLKDAADQTYILGPVNTRPPSPLVVHAREKIEYGQKVQLEKMPFVDTGKSTHEDVDEMCHMAEKTGWWFWDMHKGNIGRTSDGRLYIVDPDAIKLGEPGPERSPDFGDYTFSKPLYEAEINRLKQEIGHDAPLVVAMQKDLERIRQAHIKRMGSADV